MLTTLTDTAANRMKDKGTAVRVGDALFTRKGHYAWRDSAEAYVRIQAMTVDHVFSAMWRANYQWDQATKRFERCDCTKCQTLGV